ncbi:hypothetical protein AB0C52_21540 [Streptomyces sp. NPDC048717]|uniref:hypothetical protein n=1 Tax=Streptomyces sp. NPDC048717 TaxID=3154928 RepID=UPI00341CF6BB
MTTSRAFTRFVLGHTVRNPTVGRGLGRLAPRAGFTVESVHATTPVLRDAEAADYTLGLGRNLERAVAAGLIGADRAHRWFDGLMERPFQASFTLFTVVARH